MFFVFQHFSLSGSIIFLGAVRSLSSAWTMDIGGCRANARPGGRGGVGGGGPSPAGTSHPSLGWRRRCLKRSLVCAGKPPVVSG